MGEGGHTLWATEEFGRAMLSDRRHVRRAIAMADALVQRPHGTMPRVFPNRNELRAAYDFLHNAEISADDLLTSRHQACASRIDGHNLVLVAGDGSSWAFTDNLRNASTGPIGTHRAGARGLKVHSLYALQADGTPVGILSEHVWARAEQSNSLDASLRPLQDKESFWWTELQRQAEQVVETTCKKPPILWYLFDREADQTSVLLRATSAANKNFTTVRADDDRNLAACTVVGPEHKEAKLHDALSTAERVLVAEQTVRCQGRRRTARVQVFMTHVTLRLRERYTKRRLGDVSVGVVMVREINPPAGEEALFWLLYTTHPLRSAQDALLVVQTYALRWRIERHHFTTKTGALNIETSQLRSFDARRKLLVMVTSASARLQHVLHRARTEPDISALDEFTESEVTAVRLLLVGRKMSVSFKTAQSATLMQVVESIARLGGYQGVKHTHGPPGIQTFTRGFEQIEAVSAALEAQRLLSLPHGTRDEDQG